MRFSRGASITLALLLALTLSGKALLGEAVAPPDPMTGAEHAAAALRRSGFATRTIRLPRSPGAVALARRGACRMLAGPADAASSLHAVYGQLARTLGPVRYIYDGTLYGREPRLRTIFGYYWRRELRRVGIRASGVPLIAIAGSAACDWSRIDLAAFRG